MEQKKTISLTLMIVESAAIYKLKYYIRVRARTRYLYKEHRYRFIQKEMGNLLSLLEERGWRGNDCQIHTGFDPTRYDLTRLYASS